METSKAMLEVGGAEQIRTLEESIAAYLNALRLPDTKSVSRGVYIGLLQDIFDNKFGNGYFQDTKFKYSLSINERDNVRITEQFGRPLDELWLAGVNNNTLKRQVGLVLEDGRASTRVIPLSELPEDFSVRASVVSQ